MKRFLIALLLCIISFGAKADFLSDTADFASSQITSIIPRIFHSVDSSLRSYVDEDDYQIIVDNGVALYYTNWFSLTNLSGYNAAYDPEEDSIRVNTILSIGSSKSLMKGLIHHEVQHLKDFVTLKEEGYNTNSIMTDLDKTSQMLLGGILEARAYTEQTAYLYIKGEEFRENIESLEEAINKIVQRGVPASPSVEYQYLKSLIKESLELMGEDPEAANAVTEKNIRSIYEQMTKEYKELREAYVQTSPAYFTFGVAISKGKSIEEAKRLAAKSILESSFFKAYYLNTYDLWEDGDLHISPETFLKLFGEDIFTLDDFYSMETFWLGVCNRMKTTNSSDCQSFWKRYESNNCPNIREKWSNCRRLETVINVEKKCGKCCSENSHRKITTKQDDMALKNCCKLTYFPLSH